MEADWQRFSEMLERASELFEVLCALTDGEAKLLIRESPDGDGFAAWHTLATFYSRRTLARALRLHRAVLNPSQLKHMKDVPGGVAKWESALKELERVEGTRLPDLTVLAAFTELCPDEIRDVIFQNLEDDSKV